MQLEQDYQDWAASKGRYGDTMLAHVTPEEAELLKSLGGSGTINPETGLREFGGLWELLFGKGGGGGLFGTVVSKASDVLRKTGESLSAIATNILKNPLPVIASVGLSMMGVPPMITSAAISALQGGKVQDIALAAVGAYAGQAIGQAFSPAATATIYDVDFTTGEAVTRTIAADTKSIVQQMVVNGSKDAAIALAQTGDLNKAIAAGATGAVTSMVTDGLKKSGYDVKLLPPDMIGKVSANALTAVANGKSVSDAIAQSVVTQGLGKAITNATGQQVSASLLLKSAKDVAVADRQKADDFYKNSILSRPQEVAAAAAGIQKLSGLADAANYNRGLLASAAVYTKRQMEEESRVAGGALSIARLAAELKAKNPDAYKSKYSYTPTGEYMTSDQLMQYTRDQYDKTDNAVNAYNNAYHPLAAKVKEYNDAKGTYTGLVNKVNMDVGQVNRLGAAHQSAIDNLSNSVLKYQTGMIGEGAALERQAADKAIAEAKDYYAVLQKQKEDSAKLAGFKNVTDMEKAGVMVVNAPDYYARTAGFQNAADQTAAKGADAKTFYTGMMQQKQAEAGGFKSYADFTAAKGAKAPDYYALQDAVGKGFKTVADMNTAGATSSKDFYANQAAVAAGFKNTADQAAAAANRQTAAQFYAPPPVTAPAPTTTSPLTTVAQNPATTAPATTAPKTTAPPAATDAATAKALSLGFKTLADFMAGMSKGQTAAQFYAAQTAAPVTSTLTPPVTTKPATTAPATTTPPPTVDVAKQKATEMATKLGFKTLDDFMKASASKQTATAYYAPKPATTAAAPLTSTVVPAVK